MDGFESRPIRGNGSLRVVNRTDDVELRSLVHH
jgi:hypothetical protein